VERTVWLAGGCFWGAEKYLSLLPGVLRTLVGYANSSVESPDYKQVCSGLTGAAEAVEVAYDPDRLPLPRLLAAFLDVIDPTSLNRQGGDVGAQYRTGIYWRDPADESVVRAALAELQAKTPEPVVVEALPLANFYPAEDYHQDYLGKNPGGYCHIGPAAFARAAQWK
jgi:methionine-S-sulfoxide reductase